MDTIATYREIVKQAVYIEYDGVESGIAGDLMEIGIPEEDIVLAFVLETQVAVAV